jgi:hypothetical protein
MSEPNKSRRALLITGLKALALLAPVAAVIASAKPAEATWRGNRRRYYRRRY